MAEKFLSKFVLKEKTIYFFTEWHDTSFTILLTNIKHAWRKEGADSLAWGVDRAIPSPLVSIPAQLHWSTTLPLTVLATQDYIEKRLKPQGLGVREYIERIKPIFLAQDLSRSMYDVELHQPKGRSKYGLSYLIFNELGQHDSKGAVELVYSIKLPLPMSVATKMTSSILMENVPSALPQIGEIFDYFIETV